jgi:hypothetical protein
MSFLASKGAPQGTLLEPGETQKSRKRPEVSYDKGPKERTIRIAPRGSRDTLAGSPRGERVSPDNFGSAKGDTPEREKFQPEKAQEDLGVSNPENPDRR